MTNLLYKEIKLAASPLTWVFICGALMTMLPGYPILVGSFFVCTGMLYSFQNAREANDTLYSVLLPVRKRDFVVSKYLFCCMIELTAFVIASVLTALRMALLSDALPYKTNALMNASPVYLAFVLIIYLAFNGVFLTGFFKTAYRISRPFVLFAVVAFIIVGIGEMLHFLPGMAFLNNPAGERLPLQFSCLAAAALLYAAGTYLALKASVRRFERIDL